MQPIALARIEKDQQRVRANKYEYKMRVLTQNHYASNLARSFEQQN